MKTFLSFTQSVRVISPILVLLVATANLRAGGVTLTVSPSSITNSFIGKVTLTIAGAGSGTSVRVEKVVDLNNNGVADAVEPVVRSFIVTDGQMPIICGRTNLNVPGDTDGLANGQIKVDLFYPGTDNSVDCIAAKTIYRVSTPGTGSLLAAQPFTNNQKIYLQGARGRITAGGAAVSNNIVALSRPNAPGTFLAVTDTNGNYSFYALPGDYVIVAALKNGFVSDQNTGAVTVVANQFVTNNFALMSAGFTISGKVSDSSSGKGIAGITITANSTNNLFSLGVTDTNGNYSFPATANQWKVKAQSSQLPAAGYLSPNKTNITVTSSSVSNVNF